jgi:hypothetical protein
VPPTPLKTVLIFSNQFDALHLDHEHVLSNLDPRTLSGDSDSVFIPATCSILVVMPKKTCEQK